MSRCFLNQRINNVLKSDYDRMVSQVLESWILYKNKLNDQIKL